MKYDKDSHHRHSIRLKNYDYSESGAYFITICAYGRECLFGEIRSGEMRLNEYGNIVFEEWQRSTTIRKEIEMDEFIIMPNRIHGIVIINNEANVTCHTVGANGRSPLQNGRSPLQMKPKSISTFIAGFKSVVTKRINAIRNMPQMPVWQRNYYEHVIRNEKDLNGIREYIINNPLTWDEDTENPANIPFSRGERPFAPTNK